MQRGLDKANIYIIGSVGKWPTLLSIDFWVCLWYNISVIKKGIKKGKEMAKEERYKIGLSYKDALKKESLETNSEEFSIVEDSKSPKEIKQIVKAVYEEAERRQFLRENCPVFRQCEAVAIDYINDFEEQRDLLLSIYNNQLAKVESAYQKADAYEVSEIRRTYKRIINNYYKYLTTEIGKQKAYIENHFSRDSLIERTLSDSFVVNYLYGLINDAVFLQGMEGQDENLKMIEEMFVAYVDNMKDYLDDNDIEKTREFTITDMNKATLICNDLEQEVGKFCKISSNYIKKKQQEEEQGIISKL